MNGIDMAMITVPTPDATDETISNSLVPNALSTTQPDILASTQPIA